MLKAKAKRGPGVGSEPKIISGDGGIPNPILISERVAAELFVHVGMTRDHIRKLIDEGTILRRTLTIDERGRKREHTGILYQDLVLWAQALPIKPPHEY